MLLNRETDYLKCGENPFWIQRQRRDERLFRSGTQATISKAGFSSNCFAISHINFWHTFTTGSGSLCRCKCIRLMLMILQLHPSLCTVVKLHISRCACFPLQTANECCCLQYRLPVADVPPAAARQSLQFFCASGENQAGNIFGAPGIAILTPLSSPAWAGLISAACWRLLCILKLPVSTDEMVIISTVHARIGLTKLEDHVPVLAV